jgi:hypothetical protein
LQEFVLPGTIITSDCWAAYGGIKDLPQGYEHYTVNHSENIVDPETGANTQQIESEWQKFKARHKKEYGTKLVTGKIDFSGFRTGFRIGQFTGPDPLTGSGKNPVRL